MSMNLGTAASHAPMMRQKVQGGKPMPYASQKQRGYFNANRKKIGPAVVDEFNQASKGMDLPEKAPQPPAKKSHWTSRAVGKGKKK
jgi:hypothetical protein